MPDVEESESAWVFPNGLEAGQRVLFFSRCYWERRFQAHGDVDDEHKTIAFGEVTEVDGDTVSFSWAHAASQHDQQEWSPFLPRAVAEQLPDGSKAPWPRQPCDFNMVPSVFQLAPSDFKMAVNCRMADLTTGLSRAHRCDEYRIRVPEKAWALLPRREFVVSLRDCRAAKEGKSCVEVATLGGDEMQFDLAKDSTVQSLMSRVAEERHCGPDVLVKVLTADGVVLDAASVLEVVTTS
jgi:hypothetical protein